MNELDINCINNALTEFKRCIFSSASTSGRFEKEFRLDWDTIKKGTDRELLSDEVIDNYQDYLREEGVEVVGVSHLGIRIKVNLNKVILTASEASEMELLLSYTRM